jgi:hypothetical protein
MFLRLGLAILIISLATVMGACNGIKAWFAREFMQEQVSDGLARLSTGHVSLILSELNKRFDGNEASLVVHKDHHAHGFGKGEVIWSVKDLDIDYQSETVVHTDCQGGQIAWQGKAHIISASRVMKGRLTHNKEKPVIPDHQTVFIKVHARVENLTIRFLGQENYLTMDEGEIEFEAYPRLAQSQNGPLSGLRIVPTSNMLFEQVKLTGVKARLFSRELTMPTTIDSAKLTMQVGQGENNDENKIFGTISIFGQEHQVPADGQGLDPSYDKKEFDKKFLCRDELAGQIAYEHVAFEHKIASPVALLNTLMVRIVAERFEENTHCGMASPDVMYDTVFSGTQGSIGHLSNKVSQPCLINFSHYQIKPDCFGKSYIIDGSAQVLHSEKKVSGLIISNSDEYKKAVDVYASALRRVGTPNKPSGVIPAKRMAVDFSLGIKVHGLNIREVCLNEGNTTHPHHCKNSATLEPEFSFTIYSGQIEGHFKPILAKQMDTRDGQYGFCSVKSSVSQGNIRLSQIKASIKRGDNDIHVYADGDYELIRGQVNSRENELLGEIIINDVPVAFSGPNKPFTTLDTSYNPNIFLDSFMSCETIELPKSDDDCLPEKGLALNITRLLVMNAGSLIKLASSKEIAGGFASKYGVSNRQLKNNEHRLILPALRKLEVDLEADEYKPVIYSIDGLGNRIGLSGKVTNFEGELIRDGIRINQSIKVKGYNINPFSNRYVEALTAYWYDRQEIFVRPDQPDRTLIRLSASLDGFAAKMYKAAHKKPRPYLWIKSGGFLVVSRPVMGMDARTKNDKTPSYSVATPIMKFDEVAVNDAEVVLRGAGFYLPLFIKKASLTAFNGYYQGDGNYIEGDIEFAAASDWANLPTSFAKIAVPRHHLNPDYDQNLFNQSYANTPHLESVLPSH